MSTGAATAGPRPRRKVMILVSEVAETRSCSERHVLRMAETGRMPAPIRLGSLVRWNQDVIDRWIEAGCPAQGGGR